jgi:WhiB family redox-sensing transcriptional regulator
MADYSRLPGAVRGRWRWQELAACRGLQTWMFFHPEHERGPARLRREAAAKAVCHRCPVIGACRRHALQVAEPYGVWGGMSAEERSELLRASRRAPSVPAEIGR